MLRIAICDDEKYDRDRIQALLLEYLETHNLNASIDLFSSGKEFLSERDNLVKYDIVFLDINMEEIDGIQTAQEMRSFQSDTCIVLVTAFINYVLEGYKVGAVRYIMKDALDVQIKECMDAIIQKMQFREITFPFLEGDRTLYTDNILYVESRKHKCIFSCMERENVTYQLYGKLDQIEIKLERYGFLRIHKSFLVNMKHVKRISNYIAVMDSGDEFPVSRLRFTKARESFVAYKGAM
ncbi:LytTR family DNA-binding domain-containing protein [Lachnospiraceae bacterium 48-21]|nr:response regulator transcription factor [Dorea sp.]